MTHATSAQQLAADLAAAAPLQGAAADVRLFLQDLSSHQLPADAAQAAERLARALGEAEAHLFALLSALG